MFLEVSVVLAVALLIVVIALLARRPAGDPRVAELQRDLADMRTAQETARAAGAVAQLQALEGFHSKVGELTTGLTAGQGQASKAIGDGLDQTRRTLNDQIAALSKTLNDSLATSQQGIGSRLGETGQVVAELRKEVAALNQMTAGIQAVGKEVQDLQNVLRAPKLRGNLGEELLGEVLHEILGPSGYEMQHRFSDGSAVDAAIRLRGQWVSVDAKFPLESFNRMHKAADEATRAAERKAFSTSVRGRVDEIATKYIRPEDGTFEFALMYLPAEGIYYEVVIRDEAFGTEKSLLSYALERKVIPVSPNTLYAYLSTIVMGLQGMSIEKRAREIQGQVATLQQRFGKFFEVFDGLGKNLDIAQRKFADAQKKAGKVNDLMGDISGERLELPEEGAAPPADVRVPLPAAERDAPA